MPSLYALPPAGDPIRLQRAPAPTLDELMAPWLVRYYGSGTASLAAAIMAAIRVRGVKAVPEVLLPAYACPDLVSAVVYAGARPVLVDLEAQRPWLSLRGLQATLSERTVAVIAVHLFGIRERMTELRQLTRAAGALLIEDSAQALPAGPRDCRGDAVVLSFGRGKPVSLLGGGAVLVARDDLLEALPQPAGAAESRVSVLLKAWLYNSLRRPSCYWLPQRLPGLALGATRFRPLRDLAGMDAARRALLPANLSSYQRRPNEAQHWLAEAFAARAAHWEDLPALCGGRPRLLRYPLLLPSRELRETALRRLSDAGLGPSRMYPVSLKHIAGVAAHLHRCGEYPNADAFAARILTLPTHSGVRRRDVLRAKRILCELPCPKRGAMHAASLS